MDLAFAWPSDWARAGLPRVTVDLDTSFWKFEKRQLNSSWRDINMMIHGGLMKFLDHNGVFINNPTALQVALLRLNDDLLPYLVDA